MWMYGRARAATVSGGLVALLLTSASVHAGDDIESGAVRVQGFGSVGWTQSTGGNYYGKSTRSGGTFDYWEAGLSGYAQLGTRVSAAGQVISRRAGATSDGQAQLDYGFVDLQWGPEVSGLWSGAEGGVRLGRVKNPVGFFNTTRDVLSTRPSILLPQSIYLEGSALREVVFSGDGVQLYQSWISNRGTTELVVNRLRARSGTDQMRRNRLPENPGAVAVDVSVAPGTVAQLKHDSADGRIQAAVGYAASALNLQAFFPPGIPPLAYGVESKSWVVSGRFNAATWSATAEWRWSQEGLPGAGLPPPFNRRQTAHSGYVQGDWRWHPRSVLFARHDRLEALGQRGRDAVVGGYWRWDRHWQINAEFHDLRGANMVTTVENPQRADRTRLWVVMAGYRF